MRRITFVTTRHSADFDTVRRVLAEVGIRALTRESAGENATVRFDCPGPLVMPVAFIMEGFIRHHFVESAEWRDGDGPTADSGRFGSWLRDSQDAAAKARRVEKLAEAVELAAYELDKVRKA